MRNLNILRCFQSIQWRIVQTILNFKWIHISAYTKSTFSCELYHISTDSSKSIKDICGTFNAISDHIYNSLSNMFGQRFWSNAVPWLFINFYSSVKLAEKKISALPEFFGFLIFRHFCFTVCQIISPRILVPIKSMLVWLKLLAGPFDYYDHFLILILFEKRHRLIQWQILSQHQMIDFSGLIGLIRHAIIRSSIIVANDILLIKWLRKLLLILLIVILFLWYLFGVFILMFVLILGIVLYFRLNILSKVDLLRLFIRVFVGIINHM